MTMSHLYEVKYEGKVAVVNNANSAKLVDDIISGLCFQCTLRRFNSDTSLHGSLTSSEASNESSFTNISELSLSRERSVSFGFSYAKDIQIFQLGENEMFTISTNMKQIIMRRSYEDISFCAQGIQSKSHFGIVAREPENNSSIYCYVFQCSDSSIVSDIMQTLKQAFQSSFRLSTNLNDVCHECPMNQYHLFCKQIQPLDIKSRLELMIKRIQKFSNCDKDKFMDIIEKYESNKHNKMITCQMIMKTLRLLCEHKQTQHCHSKLSNNTNDIILIDTNKLVEKFDIFKLKARRSFSNIIKTIKIDDKFNKKDNHIIKKKSAKCMSSFEDVSCIDIKEDEYHNVSNKKYCMTDHANKEPLNYLTLSNESSHSFRMRSYIKSKMNPDANTLKNKTTNRPVAWRLNILNAIVAKPNRRSYKLPKTTDSKPRYEIVKNRWRKSILEIILLIKMDKENKHIEEKQNKIKEVEQKLDYDDLIEDTSFADIKISVDYNDIKCIKDKIKNGVSKEQRGEIWAKLSEFNKSENNNINYFNILNELTRYQHSIIIDLGRTFPNHRYFEKELGPGQLSLFNVLKAYSLLDGEVGYCQGLSFVAGLLLVHMDEEKAFKSLRYLMYEMNFRLQYKTDMKYMQFQLYQFSRLLHDKHELVFNHLEAYELAPIHYCAPWLLTMFASEFPMSFVARVFDYIFIDGVEVIYKVGILLIEYHEEEILKCKSIESIMNYLKNSIPSSSNQTFADIISKIDTVSICDLLASYEIEYDLLEEVQSIVVEEENDVDIGDLLSKLQQTNQELIKAHNRIDQLYKEKESYKKRYEELKNDLGILMMGDNALTRSHDSGFCNTPTS